MSNLIVSDLSPGLSWGASVHGLDHNAVADPAVQKHLNEVFEKRGFLVFVDTEESAQMHLAISNVFGPLKQHPAKTAARVDEDTAPGVLDMHWHAQTDDSNIGHLLMNGKRVTRYSPWHFDHCYVDELNRAGVLRAVITPGEGGRTGFVDGVALYNELAPELRNRIEGLNVIYTLDVRLSKMRFGRPADLVVYPETQSAIDNVKEGLTFPRAMHPAVWTRPTGEKVLHVGAWMAAGLEGHEDAEGDALLDEVCQAIAHSRQAYWHTWRPGDMIIWDNWRMLHAVEGFDPKHERRTQRTTIKGDYGFGYFEDGKKIGEVQRDFVP